MVTTWWNSGSIRRGDYAVGLKAVDVALQFESDAPSDDLAKLISMSERGCYVLAALDDPPTPSLVVEVNGEPFSL